VRNLLRSECTSQAVLGSPAGALITARSAVLQAALRLSGKPIFAGCGLSNCTGALTYTGCAALREGSWVAPTRQFHSYCKRNPACAMQLTSPSRWSQATSAPPLPGALPLPGAVLVWRDVCIVREMHRVRTANKQDSDRDQHKPSVHAKRNSTPAHGRLSDIYVSPTHTHLHELRCAARR
jgi:hypothetical protein